MAEAMPPEMRERFLITHFFNPVRYMRLLELVSGEHTLPDVTAAMAEFGENTLGKGIVYGKDTPNFIANRVGCFGIAAAFHHMLDLNLTVEQMDAIFGANMGRPKSAIFRTADVVGIDTLGHVFSNLYETAVDDERRDSFILPDYVTQLVQSGRTGQKTGAGFYKKVRGKGRSEIMALDVATMEYRSKEKVRFPCTGRARSADTLAGKLQAMVYGGEDDIASTAAWRVTAETLIYAANRVPEIADDIVNVDRAMRWGFGWEMGPFESWDAIGVRRSVERMIAEGYDVPSWVTDMLAAGVESFYTRNDSGALTQYMRAGDIETIATSTSQLFLADLKTSNTPVDRCVSATLHDMGDGALLLEFHSKMNALDEEIFSIYERALDRLDAGEFSALVVGNEDPRAFCAGANLLMILMSAQAGEWEALNTNLHRIQQLMMRAKYSPNPVVVAPHSMALGGGAEVSMHSSVTMANAELYMGLVEVGVGLIPGAGGCKEMVVRFTGNMPEGVAYDPNPFIQKAFEYIGMAKVSTSAEEARSWGMLRRNDVVVMNQDSRLMAAKRLALGLAAGGYVPPPRQTVKAAGRGCQAAISAYLMQMRSGGFATPHDVTVGNRLASVLTGGDVPTGTRLSEQELLDLEREAFLSLCGEQKTMDRIQHMLMKGKPLRN
jgi:3-hydroxyacyl-CoA dehydrogenase